MSLNYLQNMHQLHVLQILDREGLGGAGLDAAGAGDGEGLGAAGAAGLGDAAAGALPPGTTRLRLSAITLSSFCGEDASKYLLTPASIRAFFTSAAEAVGRSCK
jgi:hypothetical protein